MNPFLIPDPEITQRTLMPEDYFLIIACDGVWDVFNNQDAVDIVKEALRIKPNDFDSAAEALRDAAYNKGSTDNISVIVVGLKPVSSNNNSKKVAALRKRPQISYLKAT